MASQLSENEAYRLMLMQRSVKQSYSYSTLEACMPAEVTRTDKANVLDWDVYEVQVDNTDHVQSSHSHPPEPSPQPVPSHIRFPRPCTFHHISLPSSLYLPPHLASLVLVPSTTSHFHRPCLASASALSFVANSLTRPRSPGCLQGGWDG